jgi:hypothetical protein
MKRLDAFDVLLTDWMLGFSILLLIAIKFAPGIVGQQLNARSFLIPTSFEVHQEGDKLRINDIEDWQNVEFCPIDNQPLVDHKCPKCGVNYPPPLIGTLPQAALYLLLILFVVKYIHERSVLRFRLYEDEQWRPIQERLHKIELYNLHERSNKASLHILTFGSRLFFLVSFYVFVIHLYIQNAGRFRGYDVLWYSALLIAGYVIPDLSLFAATRGKVFQHVRTALTWKNIGIFSIISVLSLLVFLFVKVFWPQVDIRIGFLVFLFFAAAFSIILILIVFRKFDQCSIEVTALKWLLLDIYNCLAIVTFLIAYKVWHMDITWIACIVILINLCDWLFSAWFYFGTSKFTIQGRPKTQL